jgi:hypothetical protein
MAALSRFAHPFVAGPAGGENRPAPAVFTRTLRC